MRELPQGRQSQGHAQDYLHFLSQEGRQAQRHLRNRSARLATSRKTGKKSQFDHDKKSTYPLLFKHKQVKCASCHKDDWIRGKLKTTCISCHQKDDKHKDSLGSKCETCHVEKDWKEIIFDHDRQTRAPLLGKHKQAKCAGCHKSGRFIDKMPTLCFECHEKDDIHKNKFGPMCDTCHNEKNWKETFFDHLRGNRLSLSRQTRRAQMRGLSQGSHL